jgi:predicted NBD/HSP70 family sugar kinase
VRLVPKVDESDPKRLKMVAAVASGAESRFRAVDAHLKLLAEAGLELTQAEEAAGAGEIGQAEEALDRADEALAELRAGWTAMTAPERAIVGRAAAPLRARLDMLRARLPKRVALSEGAPERDPDEEVDPAPAA